MEKNSVIVLNLFPCRNEYLLDKKNIGVDIFAVNSNISLGI